MAFERSWNARTVATSSLWRASAISAAGSITGPASGAAYASKTSRASVGSSVGAAALRAAAWRAASSSTAVPRPVSASRSAAAIAA